MSLDYSVENGLALTPASLSLMAAAKPFTEERLGRRINWYLPRETGVAQAIADRAQWPLQPIAISSERQRWRPTYDGLPICDMQLDALWTEHGWIVRGRLPGAVDHVIGAPDADKDCWLWRDGTLIATREAMAMAGHLPWQLRLSPDGKLVDAKHMSFHSSGKAWAYTSPVGAPEIVPVNGLRCGRLESDQLRLILPTSAEHPTSGDYLFLYPPSDPRFDAVTAYTHADKTLQWLSQRGIASETGVDLFLHTRPGGNPNNALFVPAAFAPLGRDTVLLGDGDGQLLQNLGRDPDVMAHELGHLAIYQSVTETRGESLMVHEGLADTLQALKAEDPCLGERICPDGSTLCEMPGKCLRTAANHLRLGEAVGFGSLHRASQVLSGWLWSLHSDRGWRLAEVEDLVLQALPILPETAGVTDLYDALILKTPATKRCSVAQEAKLRDIFAINAAFSPAALCHHE